MAPNSTIGDKLKAYEWMKTHVDKLRKMSSKEAAEEFNKLFNCHMSPSTLLSISRESGLNVFAQKDHIGKGTDTFSVVVELAKEIRALNEEFGRVSPRKQFLDDVISRKFWKRKEES